MAFDETFFITGFPGFLATRLVERLATENGRFLLLVQPAFTETAQQKVDRIVRDTGVGQDNFRLVTGDITEPELGLSLKELEITRREITTIFHLAAAYDLAVERTVAMLVNVVGTRNVNDFARSVKNLRRYNHVSTCYVAGRRTGVIFENELQHEQGFRNHYEESKYLAETEVEALKSELPITIHRPAVVCGHSQTGETAKYDGIYYLVHYLRKWPRGLAVMNIGNDEVSLNLVPFDFVIEAIAALSRDDAAVGETVQLADPAPLTTEELFDEISQMVGGRKSAFTVPRNIVYPVLMAPGAPKITGLPHSAVPYFFLEQTYDTTRARALLEPHGILCPPFPDYVRALVQFVTDNPSL